MHRISYVRASASASGISGTIPILDVRYGNIWTNIPDTLAISNGVQIGDRLSVIIREGASVRFEGRFPFLRTFAEAEIGDPLLYVNSLGNLSLALNQASFAAKHGIGSGSSWSILIRKD